MSGQKLNYPVLFSALDAKRTELQLSWRQVAAETDVPPGTFKRLRLGNGCQDTTLVSLLHWLGLADELKPFFAVEDEPQDSEPSQ